MAFQAAVARRRDPLRGTAAIGLAVGAVVNKYKVAKHFDLNIADTAFSFARKTAEIAKEAAVQTSEALLNVATIRLMLHRVAPE